MLKKAHRLKSRHDFKRTLAGRRLCANDCFVVYGLEDRRQGSSANPVAPAKQGASIVAREPRFGFIVSKKIHKRAVVRNRIRRRLRELVRTWLLPERRDMLASYRALVFIARNGSLEADYTLLKARLERCFRSPAENIR